MTFRSSVPMLWIDSSSSNPFARASAIAFLLGLTTLSEPAPPNRNILARAYANLTPVDQPCCNAIRVSCSRFFEQFLDLAHEVTGRERFGDVEVGAHRKSLRHLRITPLRRQHAALD